MYTLVTFFARLRVAVGTNTVVAVQLVVLHTYALILAGILQAMVLATHADTLTLVCTQVVLCSTS